MNAVRWKTATFAGHQLRYAVTGSGPAVVLPKKDRGSYVPFELLADQYTMVQIEPLGFGRSDRPDPYPPSGSPDGVRRVQRAARLARMNRERRVPVGSRTFWNWFHNYNWHAELRQMAVPKLMYWGTLDAQRVSLKDQYILRGLGIDVAEFAGLNHGGCGLGDPESPATDLVADWLQRHGW